MFAHVIEEGLCYIENLLLTSHWENSAHKLFNLNPILDQPMRKLKYFSVKCYFKFSGVIIVYQTHVLILVISCYERACYPFVDEVPSAVSFSQYCIFNFSYFLSSFSFSCSLLTQVCRK